jgi:hypothetical protein
MPVGYGATNPVDYPDYNSKEKAQSLVKAVLDGQAPDLIGRSSAN